MEQMSPDGPRAHTPRPLVVARTLIVVSLVLGSMVAVLAPVHAARGAERSAGVDLVLTATAGTVVDAGQVLRRTLTATNRGSDVATDVHVVAWLPPGVRIATILPVMRGGTCTVLSSQDGGAARLFADCRRDRLAAGASASMVLDLEVTPSAACGQLVTLTEVSAANEPAARVDRGNRGRIADRLPCPAEPGADVAVTMAVQAHPPVAPGARFGVRIDARNRGDATATDVEIAGHFPDGTRPLGLAGLGAHRCTVVSSRDAQGREPWSFTCQVGSLDPGSRVVLQVRAVAGPDPACGSVRIDAGVSARNEPKVHVGADNSTSARVTLGCRAVLQVAPTTTIAAHVGDAVPVRVSVTNTGGSDLRALFARATGCDPGTLRRTEAGNGPAALSPGETWVYGCRRTLRAGDPSRVAVSITIEGRERGGARAADRGTFTIDVLRPSISLDVMVDRSFGTPGQLITARYVVRNTGNTTMRDLWVRDPALGVVGSLATLSPGATRTLTVSVRLPTTPGTLTRTITAAGSDRLGRVVAASTPLTVTVLGAFTDPATGPGTPDTPGGTAFSGSDVGSPAATALLLLTVGALALVASRRRRLDT